MRHADVRSDFFPEWFGLGAIAAIDAIWAAHIGFHLVVTLRDGLLLGGALGVTVVIRIFTRRTAFGAKAGMMAEFFSLTAAATLVFGVLSYLCVASSGPLVDGALLAADRVLGFDWQAGFLIVRAHPILEEVLRFAYDSLVYQGLYFCVLMALMDRKRTLRDMFWVVFVSGLLTSAGTLLFPALGPYKIFAYIPKDSFVPEIEHLKSGHDLTFALARMTGVVSFPSFHTAMALAYAWGFRRCGAISWMMLGLNALMLSAIPWFGGHYLVDMLAGAAVMITSLAIIKLVPRLWMLRPSPPLETTAAA